MEFMIEVHPPFNPEIQSTEMTPWPVGTESQLWTPSSNSSVGSENARRSPEMPPEPPLDEPPVEEGEAELDEVVAAADEVVSAADDFTSVKVVAAVVAAADVVVGVTVLPLPST